MRCALSATVLLFLHVLQSCVSVSTHALSFVLSLCVCVCVHVSICTLAMTFEYPLAELPGQPFARIMTFLLLSNIPLRSRLVSRSLVS